MSSRAKNRVILLLCLCIVALLCFYGWLYTQLPPRRTVPAAQQLLTAEQADALSAEDLPAECTLEVQTLLQYPELPNGCEVTSAAMVLNYLGYSVTKSLLSDVYLPRSVRAYGQNPELVYLGDPRSNSGTNCGLYCFTGPIVQAANGFLSRSGAAQQARDLSGCSEEELVRQLAQGHPVIVWVTRDFSAPARSATVSWPLDGGVYVPYTNLHCLVLRGYTPEEFLLSDPYGERVSVSRGAFLPVFEALGSRAVVID